MLLKGYRCFGGPYRFTGFCCIWHHHEILVCEFCSTPYCGPLIPQSVSRHLVAGRLINFFIWHFSCCQLHTSVPIKDKITVSMYMNIHAAAFLLGCFPAQRCGAVYCHLLKSLHLDVALTSFPHAAQPILKTRHSLGASSHVGDPGRSSLQPSRSAQEIALCWACLLA